MSTTEQNVEPLNRTTIPKEIIETETPEHSGGGDMSAILTEQASELGTSGDETATQATAEEQLKTDEIDQELRSDHGVDTSSMATGISIVEDRLSEHADTEGKAPDNEASQTKSVATQNLAQNGLSEGSVEEFGQHSADEEAGKEVIENAIPPSLPPPSSSSTCPDHDQQDQQEVQDYHGDPQDSPAHPFEIPDTSTATHFRLRDTLTKARTGQFYKFLADTYTSASQSVIDNGPGFVRSTLGLGLLAVGGGFHGVGYATTWLGDRMMEQGYTMWDPAASESCLSKSQDSVVWPTTGQTDGEHRLAGDIHPTQQESQLLTVVPLDASVMKGVEHPDTEKGRTGEESLFSA